MKCLEYRGRTGRPLPCWLAWSRHGCLCDICRDWIKYGSSGRRGRRVWNHSKNPGEHPQVRAREYARRGKYGLSRKEQAALLIAQGGRCRICGWQPAADDRPFSVDHDHKTGAVRGYLCNKCNSGLGWFNDDPALLRAAADYLERRGA